MDFSNQKFQIQLGCALTIGVAIAYYFLLVSTVGSFSKLFSGLEVSEIPIQTKFIFSLANIWWLFSVIVATGVAAMYFLKPRIGYILYSIPVALLPIIVLITIWAIYSPIFSLAETQ
ncbi:hypothetical protein [Arenicella xantha]|uniref:Uncharacterized protein n=1 Tax=Arenicella xantha TaxID=644221 RepID=A0A395JFD1_9GAMM|nr:hypothetical protein [Arenicella xantha]RBP47030.1 hypothetical protein DFR28_1114 [Arenicella xantha]